MSNSLLNNKIYWIKDIEDENLEDDELVKKIELLIKQNGFHIEKCVLEAQTGYDNFYLIHYAAKMCRSELCKYLITKLGFGKYFLKI